ncbi:hypothetical protein KEM55_001648, partial [Ascosphaera atra]
MSRLLGGRVHPLGRPGDPELRGAGLDLVLDELGLEERVVQMVLSAACGESIGAGLFGGEGLWGRGGSRLWGCD